MNYPAWDVPFIGSGWVIGIIAIIHVYISHFAIGGGLFLPMAEAKALKEGRRDWLLKLRGYSKFFLVLTGVAGTVTGVAIWFAIGLASPEGTSALIHNFVFAWAMEWVVFMVELSLSAAYYYTWSRVSDSVHLTIGRLYAVASFLTLFIINGILTFMLTPGEAWLYLAGTGREASVFFQALFNPTFWPSLGIRTLGCISLAGIYALVFFSRFDADREGSIKIDMIRWATKWLIPAFLLMPFFFAWELWIVPSGQRELITLGFSTIGTGTFSLVTRMSVIITSISATLIGVVYFLAYYNPRDFRLGHALVVFFLGLLAMGASESAREMLRKPFVISNYIYSNGLRKSQVSDRNAEGFFAHSMWAFKPPENSAEANPKETGRRMFLGQCLPCHTLNGYRGMNGLLQGRDEKAVGNILEILHAYKDDSPYRKFMPPLTGTPEEIAALKTYLSDLGKLEPTRALQTK
jgi:cytochrome bd ubiquinol oxidase subunit I